MVLKRTPGGGGDGRTLERAVEAIVDMADKLGAERLKAIRLRREIEDAIASVRTDGCGCCCAIGT